MENEELRSCMTCRFLMQQCSGNCEGCNRNIVRGINESGCRCIECRSEMTGVYRYYEPDAQLLGLLH